MKLFKLFSVNTWILIAAFAGIATGLADQSSLHSAAEQVSQLFINLLSLISLPMVFLSVVATTSGIESYDELRELGKRTLTYTLLTTFIAGFCALALFILIDPARHALDSNAIEGLEMPSNGYFSYLLKMIPTNMIQPFVEGNVMGILFLAGILSIGVIQIPTEKRMIIHNLFSALFSAVMKVTAVIVQVMPIAIWAFVTLFVIEVKASLDITDILLYLLCLVSANLVQACVVLPLFLLWKGISPIRIAKGASRALTLAFLSRSTSAALPVTMQNAEENLGISRRTARFSLPLCATINMNACAAFILITVLFVATSSGVQFSLAEMIGWVVIATIGALGNAAVPMGCYFVSSAFLAAMGVPLNILGVILPVYSLVDMLESAINVFSDLCVTAVVDKEVS